MAVLPAIDPIDREIEFMPTKAPYDPRWMLAGRPNPDNFELWQSGFFDKGSWMEIMAPWAQTVVCGRARSDRGHLTFLKLTITDVYCFLHFGISIFRSSLCSALLIVLSSAHCAIFCPLRYPLLIVLSSAHCAIFVFYLLAMSDSSAF